ncbi:MAG: hypothetical protein ABIH26_12365, partial [Candidatus Eisenbacteria bacterium]
MIRSLRSPRELTAACMFVLTALIATGARAGAPFVIETVDAAGDVGFYSSLVLDADGNPHIGYFENADDDLRYAWKSGGIWTIETVDAPGDVGAYCSLALDEDGNAHIGYFDRTNRHLKYARKSEGVWTTETVDPTGATGWSVSLVLDSEANPHISYHEWYPGLNLKYATKSGGIWTIEFADTVGFLGAYHTSIALDAEGDPGISYYDYPNGRLKFAAKSGGVWSAEVVVPGGGGGVGALSSLEFDATGNPHISYDDQLDWGNQQIRYATKSGGLWSTEIVDHVQQPGWPTSLELDGEENPHISYNDLWTGELKYARKLEGVWIIDTVEVTGAGGPNNAYSSLELDAYGNPRISYYDMNSGDLMYAMGGENIVCDPDPRYLTVAVPTNTVDVEYLGGGGGLVYGYSISVSWDPGKVTMDSITQGSLLSDAGNTWFFVSGSGSSRTVDCVLTGAHPGVSGPGTMFTISFTGAGYGTSPVDLTIIKVRDNANQSLPGFYEDDGEIHVDITSPVVTDVHLANLTLAHTDDYAKDTDDLELTADVSDDYGLSASDITANLSALLDGGGTAVPAEDYSLGVATWTVALANVDLTSDGSKSVTVTATDGLGNSGSGSDAIIVDNTAPGAITGFDAAPHHERVSMAWANPSGLDTYYYGVLVRYDGGGDYPEYGTLGAYPADETGGDGDAYDQIGVVTGGDHTIAARDIYYYTAFAYDWALNYGPAATSAEDRATNYWLGDVTDDLTPGGPYDGLVDANDFNELSAHYWEYSPGSPPVGPFNECDVGPTDTGSPFGVPEPDDYIDFEDLILFALNYNVVTPTGKVFPEVRLAGKAEAGAPSLVLKSEGPAEVGKEWSVSLCLGGNADAVKGVSVVLA